MKNILAYFDRGGRIVGDEYLFDTEEYRPSFHALAARLAAAGITFAVAEGLDSYRGGGHFDRAWAWDGHRFALADNGFTAQVIYDRFDFALRNPTLEPELQVISHPAVSRICADKFASYELAPEYFPKTLLVKNIVELSSALATLRTEIKVLKPLSNYAGRGVVIGSDAEIIAATTEFPVIISEFIDTAGGIAGVHTGRHDYRAVVIDGEIIFSFIRTPPPGSLTANFARGGQIIPTSLEVMPESVRKIVAAIDRKFAAYSPRIYSVDFGFEQGVHPRIIELNPAPSLNNPARSPDFAKFFERIVAILIEAGR